MFNKESFNLQELESYLYSFSFSTHGNWPHTYKTFFRTSNNEELFTFLESYGFMALHITKEFKFTASWHQIIAFFFCGGIQHYKNGVQFKKGEQEIHHIDGNTSNNHPRNLRYLPVAIHQLATTCQRTLNPKMRHFNVGNLDSLKLYNRKGQEIINKKQALVDLLGETMLRTALDRGKKYSVKSFGKTILKVLKDFGVKAHDLLNAKSWCNWVQSIISNCIHEHTSKLGNRFLPDLLQANPSFNYSAYST